MNILSSYLKKSPLIKAFSHDSDYPLKAFGLDGVPLLSAAGALLQSSRISGNLFLVCPTDETAKQLYSDSKAAIPEVPTVYFPSNSHLFYSDFEGTAAEMVQVKSLRTILDSKRLLVIISLRAFVSRLPSREMVDAQAISIQVGKQFDPAALAAKLTESGYARTTSTSMPGEFSIRGEVADVFPMDETDPVRIFTEWNTVDRIASYDPLTQQTVKEIKGFRIPLVHAQKLAEMGTIKSYLSPDDYFIFDGASRLSSSCKSLQNEAKSLYRKAYLENRECLKPSEVLLDFPVFLRGTSRMLSVLDLDEKDSSIFRFSFEGPRSYFGNFTFLKGDLEGLLKSDWSVTVFASSEVQKTRLSQMLVMFPEIKYEVGLISGGFGIPECKHIVISDGEIFGRRKQIVKTISQTQSTPLDSFVELNEGDYVVHVNYGIGRFIKIDRVRERDYIKIQYSGDEVLYVPIEQANLVQRYIGSAGSAPHVDKLGGSSWEHKKAKARENAEKLAQSLISLYARRKQSTGFPFSRDTDWQLQFEAAFPFDETEDQLRCVDEIKADMEGPGVMDRLVCGDVGYGKTEIAFRAAFKAIMCSKQVAFLAPTTILAEQHFSNFQQRCKDFPVKAALLSRLVSPKDQKQSIRLLSEGKVDIIFGTHRILQKDIVFNNLGLLVVDEEQRFGVKDKEKIKQIKNNVDCLSLSATPIPRTLYMSLLKIRDMSLLTTPPISRRPIQTEICEFDAGKVTEAIRKEVDRQGQVFYLHNRVESLDQVVFLLRQQMPDLIIESVHGQMEPGQVEDIMRRFVYEGIQVLVATTIIENGIDIPNVNTIIIDRADLYGVSQLYQLRGRVGRSDREAYAYLFYPSEKILSEDAIKRLKVISENTELGSGFKVAMKDMEIRGAGNILGREQSGQMSTVGLDMYIRLLDEAIAALQASNEKPEREVFFELDYSGFIPDSYITAPSIKFEIYKKIASIKDSSSLTALTSEIQNRFGPLPEEVSNLLYIAELKIVCRQLEIFHLKEAKGNVLIEFSRLASIPFDRLIELVKTSNGSVKLDPHRPNILIMKTTAISLKDKSLFILEKLQRLQK